MLKKKISKLLEAIIAVALLKPPFVGGFNL